MIKKDIVVLVIEEDEKDLEIICDTLFEAGIDRVLCSMNRKDALELVSRDKSIDLVISGIPSMDMLKKIKCLNKRALTVLCSKETKVGMGLLAKSSGCCSYIRKEEFREELSGSLPYISKRIIIHNKVFTDV